MDQASTSDIIAEFGQRFTGSCSRLACPPPCVTTTGRSPVMAVPQCRRSARAPRPVDGAEERRMPQLQLPIPPVGVTEINRCQLDLASFDVLIWPHLILVRPVRHS